MVLFQFYLFLFFFVVCARLTLFFWSFCLAAARAETKSQAHVTRIQINFFVIQIYSTPI